MTFRQIAFAISDFTKTISDDVIVNLDHILFLMSKYRNYILFQQFASVKKEIGDANYQTICIDLEADNTNRDFCVPGNVMKSVEKVPFVLTIGTKSIYPPAGFAYGNIHLINYNRFKYVGRNKYLKNIIYATIGPDGYLYLKANGCAVSYLPKVIMTALYNDIEEAALKECDEQGECSKCDIIDKRFPLDDSFLPLLMKLVLQDIVGAAWRPHDDDNNATDDLARFAQILNNYTNTAFKNQMSGNGEQSVE